MRYEWYLVGYSPDGTIVKKSPNAMTRSEAGHLKKLLSMQDKSLTFKVKHLREL